MIELAIRQEGVRNAAVAVEDGERRVIFRQEVRKGAANR